MSIGKMKKYGNWSRLRVIYYMQEGRHRSPPSSYMKECRQKLPQIGRAYRQEGPQAIPGQAERIRPP